MGPRPNPLGVAGAVIIFAVGLGAIAGGVYLWTGFEVWSAAWWRWIGRYYQATHTVPKEGWALAGGLIVVAGLSGAWLQIWQPASDLGVARWATPWNVRRATKWVGLRRSRTPRGGVIVGKWRRRYLVMTKPLHVQLFGPSRVGKTAGVIIPSVISADRRSLIVNDPSGDIAAQTTAARQQVGRVIRLEWEAANSDDGFNPISRRVLPATSAERGARVEALVNLLVRSERGDPFFAQGARSILAAATLFLIRRAEAADQDTSLGDVLDWLSRLGAAYVSNDVDPWAAVAVELQASIDEARELGLPDRVESGFARMMRADSKTRENLMITAMVALRPFENEAVRANTSRQTWDLDELRSGVSTIYLVVAPARQTDMGPVSALLIETLYDYLTSAIPPPGTSGVTFVLDEVGLMPPMRAVREGPAITAKYDVQWVIGFQDRGQIAAVYGRDYQSSLDTNTAVKIVMQLGHHETAEWVSRLIGPRAAVRRTRNKTRRGLDSQHSDSYGEEARQLVKAADILTLPIGWQIVLLQGAPDRPIRCRSALFFEWRNWAVRRQVKRGPRPMA